MGLDMATGKMMSEYTPFSELTSEEKTTYLGNAAVTTFGAKVSEGDNINVNIPLSTLVPSASVSDVTVNGSSVVSDGVAVVTVPTATGLAGDGLSVNGSTGKLDVSNKVPAPTATTDRGKVLTVDNTDAVVWATPAAPSVSIDGDSIINGANGLEVNTGRGLQIGSGAVMTRLTENGGLDYDDNEGARGIKVVAGTGVTLDSTGGVGLDFTGADNGDVLSCVKTVEDGSTTYEINWVAPGGGGGGNPYTKVSVTPGARYKNGKTAGEDLNLFDQDVSINNNTYAIVSSPIGYGNTGDFSDAKGLDTLKIKLPANTDFPMAVVEFSVYPYVSNYELGAVNEIEVYIGETKLTRIYPHPFRNDTVIGDTITSDSVTHVENQYSNYWEIENIWNRNLLASRTAIVANEDIAPIVQVNIFGNCFTVNTNVPGDQPSAS